MEKEKIYDIIQDWLWKNLGWKIRGFYRSIKNLIRWFPIIWKDRDWDSHFIFEILKTKLKHQSLYIRVNDRHTRAIRDSEMIDLCVRLIEKIDDEYYNTESYDYCKTNFKFIDSNTPGYKELEIDYISENYDEYFKKYPLIYKRVINGEGYLPIKDSETGEISKRLIAYNISHINHIRARRLLFKVLDENIERWWD